MTHEFETRLEGYAVSIYGLIENVEIENAVVVVKWDLDVVVHEWGVNGISSSVLSVDGEYDLITYDDNGEEVSNETHTFNGKDYAIRSDITFDEWHNISPTAVDIDIKEKTIEIN